MTNKKQKLELTWIGKDEELKLEPRILIEDPSKSYGDKSSENMLIHGDNLLALKALEQDFAGRIKCIYIDPPYNIAAATDHYDDFLEHSEWLNLMKPRLELLYNLLSNDGLLAVQIDDNEFAKLYMVLAEVFKSEKNLKTIVVKMSEASGLKMGAVKRAGIIPKFKEYIILAKKNGVRNLYPKYVAKEEWDKEYNIFIDSFTKDDRAVIDAISEKDDTTEEDLIKADLILKKVNLTTISEAVKNNNISEDNIKNWLFENAWRIARSAASSSVFKLAEDKKHKIDQVVFSVKSKRDGLLYLVKTDYRSDSKQPRVQLLFADQMLMTHPGDLWLDIKTTGLEAEGNIEFKNSKKPEALLERIIHMSTVTGDFILDSFLGSGTTASVAHKMNRKWIGIELGDHADTHCLPRLKSVVDGSDLTGISKSMNWKGGGGFKFYNLASSLLRKDSFGNFVIDENYNANMLAAAMCKHEGFKFYPDETLYWKHGKSTETDFIFVTTGFITAEQLDKVHSEMKAGESLLICAKAYAPECENHFANITIKKIPQMILGRCEFGKDNYDLNIIKATEAEAEESNEE